MTGVGDENGPDHLLKLYAKLPTYYLATYLCSYLGTFLHSSIVLYLNKIIGIQIPFMLKHISNFHLYYYYLAIFE